MLSPFGSRVHAPWAMAVTARLRDERGLDAEVMWSDDGFVVRVPEGDAPLDPALLVPDPDDVERLVVRQLGSTAMFAARFREAAGPGAAAAAPPARRARAAVAAAQARRRPAGRRRALRLVPDHPRDLPRVPARRLRPAGARRPADAACAAAAVRVAHRRRADAVAVRRVAALRLRRQLPLRRRRAAGRAARARAGGRSGAAARADRRGRAARRWSIPRRWRRSSATRSSCPRTYPRPLDRRRARPAAAAGRPDAPTRLQARSAPGVAAAAIDELVASGGPCR